MPALSRVSKVLLGAYLVIAALDVVASSIPTAWSGSGGRTGGDPSGPTSSSGALASSLSAWHWVDAVCLALVMPTLAAFLLVTRVRRDRLTGWVVVALGFSWIGDTVGGFTLLAKIAFFLVAQLAFAVAFWPYRRRSLLRHPLGLAAFAAALVALAALVGRAAGPLWPAIVVYAAALGTMTVLAGGVNRIAAVGGVVFLVSDLTIGLTVFGVTGGWLHAVLDAAVMPTYLSAQLLLVWGVLQRQHFERPGADPTSELPVGLDPGARLLGPGPR